MSDEVGAGLTDPGEKFAGYVDVPDHLADDPPALAGLEANMRGPWWEDTVRRAGGVPCGGPPTLTRHVNLRYLMPLLGTDGELILGEDGRPVLDRVKFRLRATGRAIRDA